MNAFPIRTHADLERAVALIDSLWDAEPCTVAYDLLEVMAQLVDAYETAHRSLPAADPIELIRFKLKEQGWSQRELTRRLGWRSAGRVSEILNRKRPLTLEMVRQLSHVFELPPGLLIHNEHEANGLWVRIPSDLAPKVVAAAQAQKLRPADLVCSIVRTYLGEPTARVHGPRTPVVRLLSNIAVQDSCQRAA